MLRKDAIRNIFRVWMSYIEATLAIAVLVAVDYFLVSGSVAFKGWPVNPLIFPVIFISSNYGMSASIFSGLLASLYYLYCVTLEDFLLIGKPNLAFDDKVVVFGFFLTSFILGHIHSSYLEKISDFDKENDELKEKFNNLQIHNDVIEKANKKLEKQIVNRFSSINRLYGIAGYLDSLDIKTLYSGAIEVVKQFFQAEKICLFRLVKDDSGGRIFQLKAATGYEKNDYSRLEIIAGKSAMIERALMDRKVITFRDGYEEILQNESFFRTLLVAPLFESSSGINTGIMVISGLPVLMVTATNIRAFAMIADWTARSIEKAERFEELRNREMDDEIAGIYSFQYFIARIQEEMSRSARHDLPLSIILLEILEFDKMTPAGKKDLSAIIGAVLMFVTRSVDIPARYSSESIFSLILPVTDEKGADVLVKKLLNNIVSYEFKPFFDDRELKVKVISHEFHSRKNQINISITESDVQKYLECAERKLRMG
ncbi:MAG: hypothetical protein HQM10_10685 [Candidatus Riflebacteria bacterium]|nr:hypothetical protein [Candidatus Riflebacteria bacterium]